MEDPAVVAKALAERRINPDTLEDLASRDNLLAEAVALSETASLLPLVSVAFRLCAAKEAGEIRAADGSGRCLGNPERSSHRKKGVAKEFAAQSVTEWVVGRTRSG